jgi:hypothetical protein
LPPAGSSALVIASHISACTHARAESVGGGGPELVSTAVCRREGHEVIVDVWASPQLANLSNRRVRYPTWYAHGTTWTAYLSDFRQPPDHTVLQMQMERDPAARVQAAGAAEHRHAPLPIQRSILSFVARDLTGSMAYAH